ncbi:hypothetical protein CUMW_161240 [Citrus unshiu]|uniref:Uncharacterized protein n=1 Tax=Citrus unshiu TaxID=55188 RepID=A0A2H5PSF4_CITUN|nr:hypothetical protein CUMW_161240 [Citrus unshiu]
MGARCPNFQQHKMAKKLWTKRDPPDLKRELGTIKISVSKHFPEHITNLSKLRNGIVKQTLEPSTREKDTLYWNNVKDYGESIPYWVRNHHPNIKVLPIKEDKKKPSVDDEYEMHNQPPIYDEYEIDDSHEKEIDRIDFSIIDMKEIMNKFMSDAEAERKK